MDYLHMYWTALAFGVLPFLISIALTVTLVAGVCRLLGHAVSGLLPLVLALSAVGAATGYFIGASRDSTVGAIAPAVITFVTGLVAYQFAKQGDTFEPLRGQLPLAITAMFTALVFSAAFAASGRVKSEAHARHVDEYYKTAALNAEAQRRENILRLEKVELPLELQRVQQQLGVKGNTVPDTRPEGK